MQRVVRSTLVGLLTVAGLTACGDKVTVAPQSTPTPGTVVHVVTVTPAVVAALPVGSTITLAASVDADAGVTARTVTWSTSDATVATVGTDGTVKGIKAGTVTITAAATADPTVKGAAVVSVVTGSAGAIPTVTISSINQTNGAGQSVPANLANVAGQVDVILNVDANGGTIRSITGTLKCGNDSLVSTQTVSAAAVAAIAADAAAAPVTFSFNTAQFSTAGLAALHNGQCTISATATSASGVQSAINSTTFTLNNADAVLVTSALSGATANDVNGLPWKAGNLTVTVTPVIYTTRVLQSVTVNIPGLNNQTGAGQTQTLTSGTGPYTFTFANATTGSNRIGQVTLVGGYDANGLPLPVVPTVSLIDATGTDFPGLAVLNPGAAGFRLDNQSPGVPHLFQIPTRQQEWVNGSYVFTGVGNGSGANANYVSGGDAGVSNGSGFGTPGASGANGEIALASGVAASTDTTAGSIIGGPRVNASVSNTTGLNGQTTFKYYYIAAGSYTAINTNGTSTSSTTCDVTGWTSIATAGDIPSTNANTSYVARVVESDKLGNLRCTDLALPVTAPASNIGTLGFAKAAFGVDKVAPTANLIDPSTNAAAAGANQTVGIGGVVPTFMVGLSDDASGFSATPLNTKLTRLAIDPSTGAASTTANLFGCPIGFTNANGCTTAATAATIAADNGSGIDGYYTFSATAFDLARNSTVIPTRTVLIDKTAPVVGGIQVPASAIGGTTVGFATSATDNLDLVSSDYSLQFGNNVSGNSAPNFAIRTPGPSIGTAFDNVLTTAASFSVQVNNFIRDLQTTSAGDAPQANASTGIPNQITVRAYDAAGNAGTSGAVVINPANVPQNTTANPAVNFAAPQANTATFNFFSVSVAPISISNCPTAGCAGGAATANPTTVVLTAAAVGSEGANFQFINPFTQVQFYYQDPTTNEFVFIGSAIAPVVTDNGATTLRTFTWTLANAFDPPASLAGTGTLKVVAIGVNASGDALASRVNTSITMTNP